MLSILLPLYHAPAKMSTPTNAFADFAIVWTAEVIIMRFAVIGGDARSALLAAMLAGDGHRVRCFALEGAALPESCERVGCVRGCVSGAEAVVLPVPTEKDGALNAPYAKAAPELSSVLGSLEAGQIVIGGALSEAVHSAAAERLFTELDLLTRESYALGNAMLTAEGAIGCLGSLSERALWGSSVLITGWGRVARALALRLLALDAEVTVTARSARAAAEAMYLGCSSVEPRYIAEVIGAYDFIVNTVPARIISREALGSVGRGAVLLELASAPGGFDRREAERLGLRSAYAPGLPGTYAPISAAELLRDEVYAIISELMEDRR